MSQERKIIPPKNKLILALDCANIDLAKNLVQKTKNHVNFYKVGLELSMSGQYFELIKWLKDQDKQVFADLKLYDISKTVENSIKNLAKHNVDMLTIHCASKEIMLNAAQSKSNNMQIIGVTVLTNLEKNDLDEMGFDQNLSIEELVIKKAKLALESGLDGIVCSALEIKKLRENLGNNFIAVTPGIRQNSTKTVNDDQKRIATVADALKNGSDYLVVGRPITKAENPQLQSEIISNLIAKFYA